MGSSRRLDVWDIRSAKKIRIIPLEDKFGWSGCLITPDDLYIIRKSYKEIHFMNIENGEVFAREVDLEDSKPEKILTGYEPGTVFLRLGALAQSRYGMRARE